MLNIIKTPRTIDFAGNKPYFTIKGAPYSAQSEGEFPQKQYEIDRMPNVNGDTIYITVFDKIVAFHTVYNITTHNGQYILPDNNTEQRLIEIWQAIGQHFIIAKYCDISVISHGYGGIEILVKSKIKTTQADFNFSINTGGTNASVSQSGFIEGEIPVKLPNYQFLLELRVWFDSQTPQYIDRIYLNENDRTAKFDVNLLTAFFDKPDLPFDFYLLAEPLKYHVLHYQLLAHDIYGIPPTVQDTRLSNEFHLLQGKIEPLSYKQDKPDWVEAGIGTINGNENVFAYGNSTGETVNTYMGDYPEFVYLLAQENSPHLIDMYVSYLYADGTTYYESFNGDFTIGDNMNVVAYRVNCGYGLVKQSAGDKEVISYSVTLKIKKQDVNFQEHEKNSFTRNFIIKPTPYFGKTFLLSDRYGLLRSAMIDHVEEERSIGGNVVERNGEFLLDSENKRTTFTAHTGWKTKEEMRLIGEALHQRFNFLCENGNSKGKYPAFLPIVILPESLTVLDEKEDFQSGTFQYYINDK